MSILDNELVRKYFGCECFRAGDQKCLPHGPAMTNDCVAGKVLAAMEQPIKTGERYLHLSSDGEVIERVNEYPDIVEYAIHVSSLRLPDRFQEKKCEHDKFKHRCCGCDEVINIVKPDPVEAKINEFCRRNAECHFDGFLAARIPEELRDLVRLARETK